MADALASGASDRKIVGVQVPPRPLDVVLVKILHRMRKDSAPDLARSRAVRVVSHLGTGRHH